MRVITQPTPNPNALKFLCEKTIREGNKINITSIEECLMVPIAAQLFQVPGVVLLHFFQNSITISKNDLHDWKEIEGKLLKIIEELGDDHDANFQLAGELENKREYVGELKTINEILDKTIRPSLQMDGGDLEILSYEENVLMVNYEGACNSCPSATSGTLVAIEGILREEYDEAIRVISA